MADEEKKETGYLETLTDEEQKILNKVIKRIEENIFYAVIKRFTYYLIAVFGFLTLAGIINFYSLSEKIENSVVQSMTKDAELKDRIFKEVSEVQKAEADKVLASQKAEAGAVFSAVNELMEIRQMVRQMKIELTKKKDNPKPNTSNTTDTKRGNQ